MINHSNLFGWATRLILIFMLAVPHCARAYETVAGGILYRFGVDYSDGSAHIWGVGSARDAISGILEIPSSLNGYPVLSITGFDHCPNLETVIFPCSLKYIYSHAFEGCGIRYVLIPSTVAEIDVYAFASCPNLERIYLEDGVTGVASDSFRGCTKVSYLRVPGRGVASRVLFPDVGKDSDELVCEFAEDCTTVGGLQNSYVTEVRWPQCPVSIYANAFAGCKRIREIQIPNTIQTIDKCAFAGSSVCRVKLPDGPCSLDYMAFGNCTELEEVDFAQVTDIGRDAFRGCSKLKSVNFPNTLTNIQEHAFNSCSNLTSLLLPTSIKNVERDAFSYCTGLRRVEAYASGMDSRAFGDRNPLRGKLPWPAQVTNLVAFGNAINGPGVYGVCCSDCACDIEICAGVEELVASEFFRVTGARSIRLPSSVTNINSGATSESNGFRTFDGCTNLVAITVDVSNEFFSSTNGVLYSHDKTTLVRYPLAKDESALNDQVMRIGVRAYGACGKLRTVNVSSNVTEVCAYAFSENPELERVVFEGDAPQCSDTAFYQSDNVTLYAYKGSRGWVEPGSTALPEKWPVGSAYARPLRVIDRSDEFRIADVSTPYCNGPYGRINGKKGTFLFGVDLRVDFSVLVEEGTGEHRKEFSHLEVNGDKIYDTKFSRNVGQFAVGLPLEVVAVAKDGTRSEPFRVNLDVADPPEESSSCAFHIVQYNPGENVVYLAENFASVELFDDVSSAFEFFTYCPNISLLPQLAVNAEMDSATGEYTWTLGLGAKVKEDFNPFGAAAEGSLKKKLGSLAGVDISGGLTGAPKWKWDLSSQSWKLIAATMGINASCSVQPISFRIPQTLHIVYCSLGFSGEGTFSGTYSDEDKAYHFSADLNPFLAITGTVGAGSKTAAAVEGYVTGGIRLSAQAPDTPHIPLLGATGGCGWRVVVCGAEMTGGYHDWTQWIRGQMEKPSLRRTMSLSQESSASGFNLLSRDYLNRSPTSLSLKALSGTVGLSEGVLESNCYPWPNPALSSARGCQAQSRTLLAYLRDDPSRTAINRTVLVRRLDDGDGFGGAEPVWDDGTPDFYPSVAISADGDELVAWVNGKTALADGADIADILSGNEIAVGVRKASGNSWSCCNLTDNVVLDHLPRVAVADDGRACVLWIRNQACDFVGSDSNRNEIMGAFYANGEWSKPTCVGTRTFGSLMSFNIAYDGTEVAIVATEVSGDGKSQVVAGLWTGVGDAEFVKVDESADGIIGNADVSKIGSGVVNVVWARDGNLRMVDPWSGETFKEYRCGDDNVGLDFTLVQGRGLAAVWSDSCGRDGETPVVVSYYSSEEDEWSAPIALTDGRELVREVSAAMDETGAISLAYGRVDAVSGGGTQTGGGRVDLCTLRRGSEFDLSIAPDDISVTRGSSSRSALLSAKVVNRGASDAVQVPVSLYVGTSIDEMSKVRSVKVDCRAGGAVEISGISVSYPSGWGKTVFKVSIDEEDADVANNVAIRECAPSLSIAGLSSTADGAEGRLRNLSATILNAGWCDSPAGVLVEFRRGSTGELIGAKKVEMSIPGGGGTTLVNLIWDVSEFVFQEPFEEVLVRLLSSDGENLQGGGILCSSMVVMTPLDSDGDGILDGEVEMGAVSGHDFVVRYSAGNYGEGEERTETKAVNVPLALNGAVFTRTGYTQTGWSKSPEGKSKDFALYAEYTSNEDVTLYPYWTANTYTLKYDLNGGEPPYYSNRESATYDQSIVLHGPSRSGYTFMGWSVTEGLDCSTAKWVKYVKKIVLGPASFGEPRINGLVKPQILWLPYNEDIKNSDMKCRGEYKDVEGAGSYPTELLNLTPIQGATVTLMANWAETGKMPTILGDAAAKVEMGDDGGFIIKPSNVTVAVEVAIPQGVDAAKVTVEVSPKVVSVKPNGAKVKIVVGENDITDYLVIPESDGALNIAAATVREEIVKETLDPSKEAVIELNAANPRLTTAPTRKGLTYTLFEGRKLESLSKADSKLGDGDPWKPMITVSGGNAAFYSIDVSK